MPTLKEHHPYYTNFDNKSTDHHNVMYAQSSKRSKDFKQITTFECETVWEQNLQNEINSILRRINSNPNYLLNEHEGIDETLDEYAFIFAKDFIELDSGNSYGLLCRKYSRKDRIKTLNCWLISRFWDKRAILYFWVIEKYRNCGRDSL